jgi:putative transcriptional regulator
MMLGCAGWGPGQLEREIRDNAWLTRTVSDSIIFNTKSDECWEKAIRSMGIDPVLLASTSGNA